jgi:4-hydroxy-3-methylbut-2-enyl diphosphate reductase
LVCGQPIFFDSKGQMKITLSNYIGFGDGVRRSLEMSYDEAKRIDANIYTDGELIHNSNTLRRLIQTGIGKLQNAQNLCKNSDSIVIRAHGITPARRKMLEALGCKLIDATCPRVPKIAGLIKKYLSHEYHIILVGDGAHPEVIGLCGHAPSEKITILSSVEEALNLDVSSKK